jgi:hypothetical protein
MSYADDLVKLRKRLMDAIAVGLINPSQKDFFEASLIQMMNDAEKNKQNCLTTAENLKKQAAIAEGQAQAFSSMSSIIYNVINALIIQSERNKLDEERRAQEMEELKGFKEQEESMKEVKATKEKKKTKI